LFITDTLFVKTTSKSVGFCTDEKQVATKKQLCGMGLPGSNQEAALWDGITM
jgi:hypothetical protein